MEAEYNNDLIMATNESEYENSSDEEEDGGYKKKVAPCAYEYYNSNVSPINLSTATPTYTQLTKYVPKNNEADKYKHDVPKNNEADKYKHDAVKFVNKDNTHNSSNEIYQHSLSLHGMQVDEECGNNLFNKDVVLEEYKWLNRFKTTTTHMFVCHSSVEYVKNERFPGEVYMKNYHAHYGNAFELFIKDCKFYITSNLLRIMNVDVSWYPKESVVKHVDLYDVARLLCMPMMDGGTLKQHIMEAMIHTLFIGVAPRDVCKTRERIQTVESKIKCDMIDKKYSWKSEDRKTRCVLETSVTPPTVIAHTNSLLNMFQMLYHNFQRPEFDYNDTLVHSNYWNDFYHQIGKLKKVTTSYIDCVSNVKLIMRDLATIMYKNKNYTFLQQLNNMDGNEADVNEFLNLCQHYPEGDVVFNMRLKDTNTQRYRLNCFKMGSVFVWINSFVYSRTESFDLESMLARHNWGTHYVISFKYAYNAMINKLHTEVAKLTMRYILSRRQLECLENDLKCDPPKFTFVKREFGCNK
ncbi:ie-1 [Matsumuraeses phaseoli granulovirus]|uniref:Ie-1 n=1 Tax=Matsumuraeses phaseoli granulovirus TaxID=2760664 RepID=A0AAE7SXK1_9BBAC|nr:ie-1 [Matsumuraeses phaseoli granulovirus]QOD39969.1 ie-1 [Matsumuraeses phaseoli granulovirus]